MKESWILCLVGVILTIYWVSSVCTECLQAFYLPLLLPPRQYQAPFRGLQHWLQQQALAEARHQPLDPHWNAWIRNHTPHPQIAILIFISLHDVFGWPDPHGSIWWPCEEFLIHSDHAVDWTLVTNVLLPEGGGLGVIGTHNSVSTSSEH